MPFSMCWQKPKANPTLFTEKRRIFFCCFEKRKVDFCLKNNWIYCMNDRIVVSFLLSAGVAQSVEQLICNQRVGGSIPLASSRI